jgi:hypothetical protein
MCGRRLGKNFLTLLQHGRVRSCVRPHMMVSPSRADRSQHPRWKDTTPHDNKFLWTRTCRMMTNQGILAAVYEVAFERCIDERVG